MINLAELTNCYNIPLEVKARNTVNYLTVSALLFQSRCSSFNNRSRPLNYLPEQNKLINADYWLYSLPVAPYDTISRLLVNFYKQSRSKLNLIATSDEGCSRVLQLIRSSADKMVVYPPIQTSVGVYPSFRIRGSGSKRCWICLQAFHWMPWSWCHNSGWAKSRMILPAISI